MQTNVQLKPALCLDLDGTVRFSKSGQFVSKPEDIVLYPDVEQRLWKYRNDGFLIVGLTNQGGVAYGFRSEADIVHELDATRRLFRSDPFHLIEYCMMHERGTVEPWCHRSLSRKPDIGMLALAERDARVRYGVVIDWDASLLVGDRPEDQACAEKAAIAFSWANDFFEREPEAG